MKTGRLIISLITLLFCSLSLAAKNIPLDHRFLHVEGAVYTHRSADKLFYTRFSPQVIGLPDEERMFPANTASSTSGIILSFKTNSKLIELSFSQQAGLLENSVFRVLRNGKDFKDIAFSEEEVRKGLVIRLDSLPTNDPAVYEIVMPSYSNLALTKLNLSENSDLLNYQPVKKKIYISYGDSITHGRGQDGATFRTYPYLIARKLGMGLYNQAVGSAKVSVPLAKESHLLPAADLITILIGYNDLNGAAKSAGQFEQDYREYLKEIRKNQPKAKIFCITLLYTKKVKNVKTGFTPEDFRNVQRKIYAELSKSDKKLFLIEGESVSSLANLKPGANTDGVHLTVDGARMLAEELGRVISSKL